LWAEKKGLMEIRGQVEKVDIITRIFAVFSIFSLVMGLKMPVLTSLE